MAMVFCRGCAKELHESAPSCVHCGAPQALTASKAQGAVPDGVRGWSWGAFLLGWIWAIGNRTWIGLLCLVPYVGFGVAIWLGIQGREMAWKNGNWDSVEHFNRVQRSWSQWGIGLFCVACACAAYLVSVQMPAVRAETNEDTVNVTQPAPELATRQGKPVVAVKPAV